MDKICVRKVKALQGEAKELAEKHKLEPNDLVILSINLEKIHGAPVEYLLAKLNEK